MKMIAHLQKSFSDKNTSSMLQALLLGEKSGLSKDSKDRFRKAGASHLLAVSGMHVGIVFWIIQLILNGVIGLRRSSLIYGLIAISLIWIFALLSGFSPSVMRAGMLLSLFIFVRIIKRNVPSNHILYLCLLALLVLEPSLIQNIGFQLSAWATIGIVELSPIWRIRAIQGNKFIAAVYNLIIVSATAQLAVIGLCIYYFHQFQTLFLLTNLLLTPLITLMMYLGIMWLIIPQYFLISDLIQYVLSKMSYLLDFINGYIVSYEKFWIEDLYLSDIQCLAVYMGLICFLILKEKLERKTMALLHFIVIMWIVGEIWEYGHPSYCHNKVEIMSHNKSVDTLNMGLKRDLNSWVVTNSISTSTALGTSDGSYHVATKLTLFADQIVTQLDFLRNYSIDSVSFIPIDKGMTIKKYE